MNGLRRVVWDDHPRSPCVEMAWRQASDVWGQGYATEAASAALRDGFERCGLAEVLAWTAATNERSQGVMRRIGMTRREELDFNQPGLPEDHPHRHHIVFGALRA
jgi:RimJ/RimL family protein N-acetyltransferase